MFSGFSTLERQQFFCCLTALSTLKLFVPPTLTDILYSLKMSFKIFPGRYFLGGASLFCCWILFKKTVCQYGLFCPYGRGILLFFHTQNLNLPVNPSLSVSPCTTCSSRSTTKRKCSPKSFEGDYRPFQRFQHLFLARFNLESLTILFFLGTT